MIPIIIICFNNYKYVDNTIKQIINVNNEYKKDIIVINNNSDHVDTINYLKMIDVQIINRNENTGPWICPWCNEDLYNSLPNKFILTDPDLEFNKKLPNNFIDILAKLSDEYKASKIGFAISIEDKDKMFSEIYIEDSNKTVYEHEEQFWLNKIDNNDYELYDAAIDTTFALINKEYFKEFATNTYIRVAGDFTCRHLPYYTENNILTIREQYEYYKKSRDSTTARVFFKRFTSLPPDV
jgi:hypothetical protein